MIQLCLPFYVDCFHKWHKLNCIVVKVNYTTSHHTWSYHSRKSSFMQSNYNSMHRTIVPLKQWGDLVTAHATAHANCENLVDNKSLRRCQCQHDRVTIRAFQFVQKNFDSILATESIFFDSIRFANLINLLLVH